MNIRRLCRLHEENISEEEGYLKCRGLSGLTGKWRCCVEKQNQNGRDEINIGFIVGTNRFFSRTCFV